MYAVKITFHDGSTVIKLNNETIQDSISLAVLNEEEVKTIQIVYYYKGNLKIKNGFPDYRNLFK